MGQVFELRLSAELAWNQPVGDVLGTAAAAATDRCLAGVGAGTPTESIGQAPRPEAMDIGLGCLRPDVRRSGGYLRSKINTFLNQTSRVRAEATVRRPGAIFLFRAAPSAFGQPSGRFGQARLKSPETQPPRATV